MGNEAMKTKLQACGEEQKERKRKNRCAKLNRGRWKDLYTLKINCKAKRRVGKTQKKNVEKHNMLKKKMLNSNYKE